MLKISINQIRVFYGYDSVSQSIIRQCQLLYIALTTYTLYVFIVYVSLDSGTQELRIEQ